MGGIIIQPDVSVVLVSADSDVSNTKQKVLAVLQGDTLLGNYTSGVLSENIVNDLSVSNLEFGPKSMMAGGIRAFKALNQEVQLDALPVDDGAGTARALTMTLAGTADEVQVITIHAGGEDYETVVSIASGQTAAQAAVTLEAALDLDLNSPFTFSVATSVVTATATGMKGAEANSLGFYATITSTTGSGLTLVLAESQVGVAPDPTLTNILDVIGDRRYQTVIWGFADTTEAERLLDARWNSSGQILDGVAIHPLTDTYSNISSALGSVNSQSILPICDQLNTLAAGYVGPAMNAPGYEKCARFAAVRSLRLTVGAGISRFMTSNASADQRGGPALASMPYLNTVIPGLPSIPPERGWTSQEIEDLKSIGGSVLGINSSGDAVLCGEMVTTYLTNAALVSDVTFTYLNYVDTASGIREYMHNNCMARFAQSRITIGAVVRDRAMVNPGVVQAFMEGLYLTLSGPDYVLVESGEDAFKSFKKNITIVFNMATGLVTITMVCPIVTQLRSIYATIKVAFGTTG